MKANLPRNESQPGIEQDAAADPYPAINKNFYRLFRGKIFKLTV